MEKVMNIMIRWMDNSYDDYAAMLMLMMTMQLLLTIMMMMVMLIIIMLMMVLLMLLTIMMKKGDDDEYYNQYKRMMHVMKMEVKVIITCMKMVSLTFLFNPYRANTESD